MTGMSHGSVLSDQPFTERSLAAIIQDRLDSSWHSGAELPRVPREALLAEAAKKLTRLMRESQSHLGPDDARSVAHPAAFGILSLLIENDSATPQIAATEDFGVEINWLVAGEWMHIDIDADGSVFLEAAGCAGKSIIQGEFNAWFPDQISLDQAHHFLQKISEHVVHRLA